MNDEDFAKCGFFFEANFEIDPGRTKKTSEHSEVTLGKIYDAGMIH